MTIKVCVSVPPKTIEEAFCLIEKAEAQHADFIEVRLDSFKKNKHIRDISSYSNTPLIATNKLVEQRGNFSGSEIESQKLLIDAAQNGFEYIDIDLSTSHIEKMVDTLHEVGAKIIVSFHNFDRTPTLARLNKVLEDEIDLRAEVCKIVTTAKHVEDNLTTLDFVSKASKKVKIVCFAMGELGKISRLLSPVFGAFFTFASINEEKKTAEGQLTIREIKRAYEALGLK